MRKSHGIWDLRSQPKSSWVRNLIKIKTFMVRVNSTENSTQSVTEIYTKQMSLQLGLEYVGRRCLSNVFREFFYLIDFQLITDVTPQFYVLAYNCFIKV